jgi:hypothetical protein
LPKIIFLSMLRKLKKLKRQSQMERRFCLGKSPYLSLRFLL